MKLRLRSAALVAVLLFSTACASMGGPRHVATVSVVSVHAVLSAVQDVERSLVCGGPVAPAPPACVPADVHRRIAGELVTAFDLDGQVARLVRALPPGAMSPADVPALLGRIVAVIDRIIALIPKSPQRDRLISEIGGKSARMDPINPCAGWLDAFYAYRGWDNARADAIMRQCAGRAIS